MPGTIAPFGWTVPLLGEGADGPDAFSDLGTQIAATLQDTTVQTYTPAWTADGLQPGALGATQGRYRVNHGMCDFTAYLGFGSSTSGGTGPLHVGLPKASRADIQSQLVSCWLHVGGIAFFHGFGTISASGTTVSPFFPISASASNYAPWTNANASNDWVDAIPYVGNFTVLAGGWVVVTGRYFCVP